jgi:hypothetical protein
MRRRTFMDDGKRFVALRARTVEIGTKGTAWEE